MAKAFGKLPSQIIDPMFLFSPLERFEINRDIWIVGLIEEDRMQQEALKKMKRENEAAAGKSKRKGRRR